MYKKLWILVLILCISGINCIENKCSSIESLSITNNNTTSTNNTKSCDKSQLTALLLSIFVGSLGVDRFYLGYMDIGVGKLVLFIAPIFIILIGVLIFGLWFGFGVCCTFLSGKDFEDLCVCCGIANISMSVILIVTVIIICSLAYLAVFVWWLVDLIFIATSQLAPLLPLCYSTTL